MSRRLLLTGRGTDTVIPDPVDPTPDPDVEDTYALYSTTMPNAHTAVVRVGAGRTHTTVSAGIAAADALVSGTQRALVIIDAGTYNEQVGTPPYVDVAGATGDPTDVTIEHTCPTGFSPINTNGGPTWIGGLTTRLIPYPERVGSGVYGIHHHATGLSIFERLIFDTTDYLGAIGMDGDAGSDTWLIDCEFTNAQDLEGLATNMHGFGDNTTPLRLVFDNVNANGRGVNYSGLDSGQADQLYVSGGSIDNVNVSGAGVIATIDPAIASVADGAGVTLVRATTLPTRPLHGA